MMDEAELTEQISPEMEQAAVQRAKGRAKAARWDLDVAVFFFAILIIVIILLFQEIELEVVGPVAILGLGLGWLMGWEKAREVYKRFYDEEILKLELELNKIAAESGEETIEEKIQKALRQRWR